MHATIWSSLRTAHLSRIRPACRIIAGVRRPPPTRKFQRSAVAYRIPAPEVPDVPESDEAKSDTAIKGGQDGQAIPEEAGVDKAKSKLNQASQRRRRRLGNNPSLYGLEKNRDAAQIPLIELPDWFWETNVKIGRHLNDPKVPLTLYGNEPELLPIPSTKGDLATHPGDVSDMFTEESAFQKLAQNSEKSIKYMENPVDPVDNYKLHYKVYDEILASIRAGLMLGPPPGLSLENIPRPDIHLQCPKHEATDFLNSIVQKVAIDLKADVVILEPEDIAQIVSNYTGQNIAWTWGTTCLLGYEAHREAGNPEFVSADETQEEEENNEDSEESEEHELPIAEDRFPSLKPPNGPFASVSIKGARLLDLFTTTDSILHSHFSGQLKSNAATAQSSAPGSSSDDHKLRLALEGLIDAVETKRCSNAKGSSKDSSGFMLPSSGLIIQINQYKKMSRTHHGNKVLGKLKAIVKKCWYQGQNMMIVGTTSEDPNLPTLSSILRFQSDIVVGDHRTIFVPPKQDVIQDVIFTKDAKLRTKQINIRHLEFMVRELAGAVGKSLRIDLQQDLPSIPIYARDIYREIWSYARIQRVAVTILGMNPSSTSFEGPAFVKTLQALNGSDHVKFKWCTNERNLQYMTSKTADPIILSPEQAGKDKVQRIKKTCTKHEKKLLGGVVNPTDIHTTFADIQASVETIDALKTLTSMTLIRPESFSYGVLATDKITGLLLYGPPGTGKTLLAKAIAKESGATVLEVSASELNDMYVGESEKNVKAVFSLAKKLSPCVIFLDEADSILGSRGGEPGSRRRSREVINQFLREWDGMRDMSTLLMVATNRPFDLDEAILRRLPRKILMDLPLECDREAILKIHLRDENLDESVSLSDIAKQTPFYSGSDLKNLSVAAALACVRDENDAAAQHVGDLPYIFPVRRTLTSKHFEKALEEISASISEDMLSLSAIRKFDERYGDRKGRRKKGMSLGFGATTEPEKDSEAGRVRKLAAVV